MRRALVALGEKAEGIDLLHEVGDAGPSAEPEAHHAAGQFASPVAGQPRA